MLKLIYICTSFFKRHNNYRLVSDIDCLDLLVKSRTDENPCGFALCTWPGISLSPGPNKHRKRNSCIFRRKFEVFKKVP